MFRSQLLLMRSRAAGASPKFHTYTRPLPVFGLFLQRTRKHPALKGLPVAQRGRKLGAMYRALPEAELQRLRAQASQQKRIRCVSRRIVKSKQRRRKPSTYNKYVAAFVNAFSLVATPQEKIRLAAKAWRKATERKHE